MERAASPKRRGVLAKQGEGSRIVSLIDKVVDAFVSFVPFGEFGFGHGIQHGSRSGSQKNKSVPGTGVRMFVFVKGRAFNPAAEASKDNTP